MKVLEDQAKIKALLEEKSAELAVIKEEYEAKKKEVMTKHYTAPLRDVPFGDLSGNAL